MTEHTTGKLVVNLDTRSVDVDGQRLDVTDIEYKTLELLSLRKGTIVTSEMLLDHWYIGANDEPELRIPDWIVKKLRKKISNATCGSDYIEYIWGRGWILKDPDSL